MSSKKPEPKGKKQGESISLAPLSFEEAVRATLATGKAPPPPKRKATEKRPKSGK